MDELVSVEKKAASEKDAAEAEHAAESPDKEVESKPEEAPVAPDKDSDCVSPDSDEKEEVADKDWVEVHENVPLAADDLDVPENDEKSVADDGVSDVED